MALSKAEQAELAALEKEMSAPVAALSPEEQAELAALEQEFPPEAPGVLDRAAQGVGAVGKLFDVARGTTTGPLLGELLEKATGKKVYSKEDVLNAVNPTNLQGFPTTSEMLARAGVGEKGSLSDVLPQLFETPGGEEDDSWLVPNKGGLLDITGRGTMGLATDIGIDPLTYASGGLLGLARGGGKVAEGLLPITRAMKRSGKRVYKSGLTPVVQAGEDFGKDVAETYFDLGIRGAPRKMEQQAEGALSRLKGESDAILAESVNKGSKANVMDVLKAQTDRINKMVAEGGSLTKKEGETMINDLFERYVRSAEADPAQITKWKEALYQGIPNSAYREGARTSLERGLDKQFAGDLRSTAESLVDMATPGKGAKLKDVNRKRGDLLTTRKAMERMVKRADNVPNPFTPYPTNATEWMLLLGGGGLGLLGDTAHGIGLGPTVVAAKRMTDIAKSPGLRTSIGYNMAKAADNPFIAPIAEGGARRLLTSPGGYYGRLLEDEEKK
jgi:hypothetical protein